MADLPPVSSHVTEEENRYVSQSTFLLSGTIMDNSGTGPGGGDEEMIQAARAAENP